MFRELADNLRLLRRSCIALLLITVSVTSAAGDYYFRCLDVESGLSQNSVYDIIQDSYGRIWAATGDGVSVYDGESFRIFNSTTAGDGLRSNVTICLFLRDDGRVYVGTGEGLSVYDPVLDTFTYVALVGEGGEPVSGLVREITADHNGNLWVAVANYGLFQIDRQDNCYPVPLLSGSDRAGRNIRSMCLAGDGNIWVSTNSQGLYRYSPLTGETVVLDPSENPLYRDIWKVAPLDRNSLLVGCSQKGLYVFDLRSHSFVEWKSPDGKSIGETIIHDIFIDSVKRLWVGTENGLYVCENGCLHNLRHSPTDEYSISDNAVYTIAEDSDGGVWVGSFFGGVNYYSEYTSQFKKILPGDMPGDLKGKSISEMCEDRNGNLWIATEDAGLNFYNRHTDSFSSGYIDATNVHALALVEDSELWVGTYLDGLYVLDVNSGRSRHFTNDGTSGSLIDNSVYSIYKGFDNTIWIGTIRGLCRYDTSTGRFERVRGDIITSSVNDIAEDIDGRIWFATIGQGVFRYDTRNGEWDRPGSGEDWKNSGGITQAITLLLDRKGNMWVGTEGKGVFRFDRSSCSSDLHYDEADGLPNGVVYKLLEDGGGNIWGSTNKGLFRISSDSGRIITVNSENGLIYNQFNYKSGVRLRGGRFLFGCVKGIASFDPDHLKRITAPPSILFNRFLLFNEPVEPGASGAPLKKSIMASDEIVLRPDQSVFSIGFTAVNYSERQDVRYYYMLKGLGDEWVPASKSATITFSRLLPAKYSLVVKAVSEEGDWQPVEKVIDIRVLPPWYRTLFAKVMFVLLALAMCGLVIWLVVLYYKRRSKMAFELMQRTREKELYNSKIDFFTNITHEIRTPLTLITVPIENVMNNIGEDDKNYEVLSIIRRNANRLLKLVNELMDFRKIDPAQSHLSFRRMEIVKIVRETCGRFSSSAGIKGIELRESFPAGEIMADVDGEVLTKILSNLLSNALKHAESLISVSLTENGQTFRLSVSNDGDRIPGNERERIFEPFVKLDKNSEGTGIGLPFARNLAEMHSGSLTVDASSDNVMFVLELPLRQRNVLRLDEDVLESGPEPEQAAEDKSGLKDGVKTILVVDDNPEFRSLMAGTLNKEYNVLTAVDGNDGLKVLAENKVDVIISDVIMPGKDGVEFCAEVKADINYSHIPFILLTAKTDPDSQIDGLNKGADDYISKPFSPKVLLARIDNLLKARARLRNAFQHSPTEPVSSIAHSKPDEAFLEKIMDYVYDHIEDTELDVDVIAKAMFMSRATLYRKLKGISDLSPNDFIRLCRLKRAAELLKENVYKVNEVAYIVGFSSPSYFAKCFQKQFGVLPKDYCG